VTRIVVFDVESTGKERGTDQIIELGLQHDLGADAEVTTWRIKPSVAIHPEAIVVHGITAEDLADCPMFSAVAPEFIPLFEAADMIVGYNIAFDLDMLQAELARAVFPPLDLSRKLIVDVLRLWHHVEPRTLVAAHAKFCGVLMTDAHQARTDVAATSRVLTSMLGVFGLADKAWSEIAAISDPFPTRSSWLGPSSHIQWDASGAVVFGFGKYKGVQVDQVDGGFLRWLLSKDFPPHVKDICRAAFERHGQFNDWIAKRYPRPVKVQPEDGLDEPFGQGAS
jgi:DNA polymerase-3 subunit epsilon